MTITYPAQSGSMLPNRRASRQLVATSELAFIAARYRVLPGQREQPVETVFMKTAAEPNGFFFPPYQQSTREGNTYTIVREGGWPKTLELHAQEEPTIPNGGQAMGAIYEVDFAALSSQSVPSPGAYTIDGITWYSKGTGSAQPYNRNTAASLVHGSGLRVSVIATSSQAGYLPATAQHDGGVVNDKAWFLPFASVPGYNPLAPVTVQYRFGPCAWQADRPTLLGGIVKSTSDGVGLISADSPYATLLGVKWADPGTAPTTVMVRGGTAAGGASPGSAPPSTGTVINGLQDAVCTLARMQTRFTTAIVNPAAVAGLAGFPDPFTAPSGYSFTEPQNWFHIMAQDYSPTPLERLGFLFGVQQSGDGATRHYDLQYLRILQPKVA